MGRRRQEDLLAIIAKSSPQGPRVGECDPWHIDICPQPCPLTTYTNLQAHGGPFRLRDGSNTKLVLPPKYIEEIKNIPSLSSQSFNVKDFFANYPGFDVFRASNPGTVEIWIRAMKKEMPAAVPLATAPMARETSSIVTKTLPPSPTRDGEWREFNVYQASIAIISRVTQLVLLGEDFMNNEAWQRVATAHSVDVFRAAAALHRWPAYLRPVVHWFLPECRRIRAQVREARAILAPEVLRRVRERETHHSNSNNSEEEEKDQPRPRRQRVLDAIDWFVAANPDDRPFDHVGAQISLAMAANQTSSNAFAYLLGDLVSHPEYAQPLRDEVIAGLRAINSTSTTSTSTHTMAGSGGSKYRALFPRLALMDSFMKESMRRHPPATITMRRHALADLRLADGVEIPRGTYLFVGPVPMTDPAVWPGAEGFDGRRFLRMREEEAEAQKKKKNLKELGAEQQETLATSGTTTGGGKYRFVSTSADFTGWDYGLRACPGRFLASNYMMLIFSYMLLHYDFRLPPGQDAYNMGTPQGFMHRPDKGQTLMYRSRECEVDFA